MRIHVCFYDYSNGSRKRSFAFVVVRQGKNSTMLAPEQRTTHLVSSRWTTDVDVSEIGEAPTWMTGDIIPKVIKDTYATDRPPM